MGGLPWLGVYLGGFVELLSLPDSILMHLGKVLALIMVCPQACHGNLSVGYLDRTWILAVEPERRAYDD
jgi:hypothetical protein